jgi:hypothetical protein
MSDEDEFTCPYCRRPIPNELHTCEKCHLTFNPEEMGKSGYVARVKGGLSLNAMDWEFFMDRKSKNKREKIFPSRFHCIDFFHNIYHLGRDDMQYMIWFADGEDKARNLWTGELKEESHGKTFFGFLG